MSKINRHYYVEISYPVMDYDTMGHEMQSWETARAYFASCAETEAGLGRAAAHALGGCFYNDVIPLDDIYFRPMLPHGASTPMSEHVPSWLRRTPGSMTDYERSRMCWPAPYVPR